MEATDTRAATDDVASLDQMLDFMAERQPIAAAVNPEDECGPSGDSGTSPPWLSVVQAARHAGWPCMNSRAPASFYELAQRIGVKINGKWRIHRDDLDAEMRRHAVPTR